MSASALQDVPVLDVWRALGGGDLRDRRGRAFWRNGDGYNVALDAEGGRWFDHAAGSGGSVLALVETALQCDQSAALSWLEQGGFIESRREFTPEERREYMERRRQAQQLAADARRWHRATVAGLEAQKATEPEFSAAWTAAARALFLTETLTATEILEGFMQAAKTEPAEMRRRVAWGESEDRECALAAAVMVDGLTRTERGVPNAAA